MSKEAKKYLLDTSAIFAFTDNEEGADKVQKILERAQKEELLVCLSAMSIMELYYVTYQEVGTEQATGIVIRTRSLPIKELPLTEDLILPAGELKARYQISVADAWIAATSKIHGLTLIHKDPEFEPLKEELDVMELPYQRTRRPGSRR